ncbi:MAG: hypothetical protein IPM49_11675 [Flavobacteriales bacterium]|nr:hypothetical protein [Flavobacteriales bacterium]
MRTRAGLDDATNDWTTLPTPTGPDAEKYRSSYTYDANGNIRTAERWDQAGAPYDALAYGYKEATGAKLLRNRLYQVDDLADPTNALVNAGPGEQAVDILHTGPSGFDPQDQSIETAYNYRYDELGNLIQDLEEEIAGIDWTVAGKVRTVTRPGGSTLQAMEFAYGAGGQRTEKTVGAGADLHREHYVRDAQGNVMAIYRHQPGGGSFTLKERALYGSSRLGRYVEEVEFIPAPTIPQTQAADDRRLQYELTDHLGNVSTVVTGRLLVGDGAPHEAQVLSAQGNEPFGSLLPGRNYSSDAYRFGFQGQEKDNELFGAEGTALSFEYRVHDARLGRFLSIDPLAFSFPWNSPYAFSENRVLDMVELEGLEAAPTPDKVESEDPKWGLPDGGEGWSERNSYDDGKGFSFKSFRGSVPDAGGTDPPSSASAGNSPSLFPGGKPPVLKPGGGAGLRGPTISQGRRNYALNYERPKTSVSTNVQSRFSIAGELAGGFGLLMEGADKALRVSAANTQFKYAVRTPTGVLNAAQATKAAKIELQTASKIAKTAGRGFGLLGAGITAIEAFEDGNVTLEEGAKIGIGVLTTFTPVGWVYGAADLGFSLFTGKSLTDRAGEMIDNW